MDLFPSRPKRHVDVIYLCSPNNPTGAAANRPQLEAWVKYALENKAVILFDAAYEAYITDPALPHSIYEIPGARECAIEFRSCSKNGGFTGVRCAFTVVPKSLNAQTKAGAFQPLHPLWLRRMTTKFNGVSYPVQRGAEALYSPEGKAQVQALIAHYLGNAKVLREGARKAGLKVFGGVNAPYIWVKAPKGVTSWQVFDKILNDANVVHYARQRFRRERRGLFPHQRLQQPRQCRGGRTAIAGVEVVNSDVAASRQSATNFSFPNDGSLPTRRYAWKFEDKSDELQFVNIIVWTTLGLVLARLAAELWLAWLNRRHVLACAGEVPPAFREIIDEPTYKKSIAYTLAKTRLGNIESIGNTIILLVVLFSGVLPRAFQFFSQWLGQSAWAMAAFLFVTGLAVSLPGWPFDWYAQFRLEQKFGFNKSTLCLWFTDRFKGLLLAMVLGYPLLALILKIVQWTGAWWWLSAWGAVMGFQFLMSVLAPVLILPLFNKFTPLPEGGLRERLFELARRTQFRAGSIQLMDGSKRSGHSNAFFTGFGRFRKIVLFDTLVQQLTEPELEAVLAHEIGHFKKSTSRKCWRSRRSACWSGFTSLPFWPGRNGFIARLVLSRDRLLRCCCCLACWRER